MISSNSANSMAKFEKYQTERAAAISNGRHRRSAPNEFSSRKKNASFENKPEEAHIDTAVLQSVLNGLRDEQVALKDVFNDFRELRGTELFEAYKDTHLYTQTRSDLERLHGLPGVENRVRGKIFADLAFCVMTAKSSSDVVISGEKVLDVAQAVYPNAVIAEHPFGQSSLLGEYVPDGLAINTDGFITGVYEYKLSDDKKKINNQGKRARDFIRKIRPLSAGELRLTVVTPENGNMETKHLPFNRGQFEHYCQDLLDVVNQSKIQ